MWFIYRDQTWWIGSDEQSVKVRNVQADPRVAFALEDGAAPVVAEGRAQLRGDAIISSRCYHNPLREAAVAAITIRNLSEETHRALKARAAARHRSTEAEVRAILDAAVAPADRVKVGSLLASIGQEAGGVELAVTREKTSREPLDLA